MVLDPVVAWGDPPLTRRLIRLIPSQKGGEKGGKVAEGEKEVKVRERAKRRMFAQKGSKLEKGRWQQKKAQYGQIKVYRCKQGDNAGH